MPVTIIWRLEKLILEIIHEITHESKGIAFSTYVKASSEWIGFRKCANVSSEGNESRKRLNVSYKGI